MSDFPVSKLLLDQLAAEGTRFVFGTPGPTLHYFIEALDNRADMHFCLGLNEGIAASMAIGYAQVSAKPGVVVVSTQAGLADALSALTNARQSRVPLIVLVGQYDTRVINDFSSTDELRSLAHHFCKWTCELRNAQEVPRLIRRAFHEAFSPPMGPVVCSLPMNILTEMSQARIILPPLTTPLGCADGAFLKRATQLLTSASKPAVIAGNEVSQYRARKEVVSLVEVLGCPAFTEPLPTGLNFPNKHQLFAGVLPLKSSLTAELLRDHDVILALGMQTRTPSTFETDSLIPSTAVVIQINVEPGLSGQALPCHFSAHADLAESISKLRAEIQLVADTQWVTNAKARSRQTASQLAALQKTSTQAFVDPKDGSRIPVKWLISILDTMRPRKSVIIADSRHHYAVPIEIMTFESSASYYATNGNARGYGLAASLGAQWANSEYTVICITTDESMLHHPQALWTAAHYGLPVKVVVLNDRSYSTLLDEAEILALGEPAESPKSRMLIENPPVSYIELAGAMGVAANSIESLPEVEPAFREMFSTEGPYVLDVRLGH